MAASRVQYQTIAGRHIINPTIGQDLEVQLQCTGVDNRLVLGLIIGHAKQDVVSQRQVLNPGRLGHIGNGSTNIHTALLHKHLGKDGLQDAALACKQKVGIVC